MHELYNDSGVYATEYQAQCHEVEPVSFDIEAFQVETGVEVHND